MTSNPTQRGLKAEGRPHAVARGHAPWDGLEQTHSGAEGLLRAPQVSPHVYFWIRLGSRDAAL